MGSGVSLAEKIRNDNEEPQCNGSATLAPSGDNGRTITAMTSTISHVVTIERDAETGSFGFTAGSERPVVIRQVTVGGPSWGKLQNNDEIVKIDSRPVEEASQLEVFTLLRKCHSVVTVTVRRQRENNPTTIPSESADKKADDRCRRYNGAKSTDRGTQRSKRVRFADDVAGAWQFAVQLPSLLRQRSVDTDDVTTATQFARDAVKVFFENDQTKTFGHRANDMTVADVLESIREKLRFKSSKSFGLVLMSTSSTCADHKMSLLGEHLTIEQVCDRIRKMWLQDEQVTVQCFFRYVFMPTAIDDDLINSDSAAFDYLYTQCCNDVIGERFAAELSCDGVVNLAALSLLRKAIDEGLLRQRPDTIIRIIESKWGLERFVPESLLTATRRKTLIKQLDRYVSLGQNLLMRDEVNSNSTSAKQQQQRRQLKLDWVKLSRSVKRRYVLRLSTLANFGGRYFDAALSDRTDNVRIFVGPRTGIEYVFDSSRSVLAGLRQLKAVRVDEFRQRRPLFDSSLVRVVLEVCDKLQGNATTVGDNALRRHENILIAADQIEDFVAFVSGYFRLLTDRPLEVVFEAHSINRDANNNSYNYVNSNVMGDRSLEVHQNFILDTKIDEIDEVTYEAEVDPEIDPDYDVTAVHEITNLAVPSDTPEELVDGAYLTETVPPFHSSLIDAYPDDDVRDWYLQSTMEENEDSLEFNCTTMELLPPLPPSMITTKCDVQSDIDSLRRSSSSSSSSSSLPSNSSSYNGIAHLFDHAAVNGDTLIDPPMANGDELNGLRESTTPEDLSLTSQYFSCNDDDDDDDDDGVIIGGVTQCDEINASWHSCASGSMTSALQASGTSSDDGQPSVDSGYIVSPSCEALDLTLILPPDDHDLEDDKTDDDVEEGQELQDCACSIEPPMGFAETVDGNNEDVQLETHAVFDDDDMLDLSLIPPPGDDDVDDDVTGDVNEVDFASDDLTTMSHQIFDCELSCLTDGLDSWKIDRVPSLIRRQFLSEDEDNGYDINESSDEPSTDYIDQYYRPETEFELVDHTSYANFLPIQFPDNMASMIDSQLEESASDNESHAVVHDGVDNDDVRPLCGTSSESVSLDVETYRRKDLDVVLVVGRCQSVVLGDIRDEELPALTVTADLPPPLPLSPPPPLNDDDEDSLSDAGVFASTSSSFRQRPLGVFGEPEVHMNAEGSGGVEARSDALPTIRNASISQLSSTFLSTSGNHRYPTISGCRDSVHPYVNGGTSPVRDGESVLAADMDEFAKDVNRFQTATSTYQHPLPPPFDMNVGQSTVCVVCEDDGFQLATDDLPAPLSPSYLIDDEDVDDQRLQLEVDPPPPPLPSSPPPPIYDVDLMMHIER